MKILNHVYHRVLLVPGVTSLFRYAQRECATVFMLHRFLDRERGITGLDPAFLRQCLAYLRRQRHEFLSLTDLCSRLAQGGPPLRGAVIFTIDDGYLDHAHIAGPVFAEFDCPVTTFVTTGFLDGALWMWWDKIEFLLTTTRQEVVEFRFGEETVRYGLAGPADRRRSVADFVQRCKVIDNEEKLRAIGILADHAGVPLPDTPPPRYAPMSWNDARICERRGMTFGPHTVTHPILSQVSKEQAIWEITESWRRLSAEVCQPVPVFCYPNGQPSDFGKREIEIQREVGLVGAVVGAPGFADPVSFRQGPDAPYELKRLPFPDRLSDLVQYACGIQRCKQLVRGGA